MCTGGALTSYGAPADSRLACAKAMLDAAGFDVVTLAHRDLVGQPGKLAGSIKGGRAVLVSASFRMPAGTPTPWKPLAIVSRGARKIAFIGIAQRSAAMALPGSGAIKGLVYVEPQEALKESLTKARGADAIVVLADAALGDAAKWLGTHKQIAAVIVSGRGGMPLAAETIDRLWLSPPGGTALGLLARDAGKATNKIMPLPEPKQINPAHRQVAKRFGLELAALAVAEIAPPSPAATAIKAGQTIPLTVHGQSRAVSLAVRSVAMLNSFGGRQPPAGRRFLVIDTRWQNVLAPQLVSRKMPVAYKVRSLGDHLHCVADGSRVLQPAGVEGAPGVLPGGLKLPRRGSEVRGRLVFEVPADMPPRQLALRFYDFAHGHIFLPLLAGPKKAAAAPPRPILPLRKNQIVELGVYAFTRSKTLGGRKAPSGMTFITLDVRGRSLYVTQADA
ncbi:MAG: hypothetical protein ACYTF6_15220, partial [Planctomycetota bacterium]